MQNSREFNVNSMALCIDAEDTRRNIREGEAYIITDIDYCPECSKAVLSVHEFIESSYVERDSKMACTCGHVFQPHIDNPICSTKFIPLDSVDKVLEEAIETENYDIAIKIRDYIKGGKK